MRWANEAAYNRIVAEAARDYGVPASIVKAVIAAESAFDPRAYRDEPHVGDASRGLMQLLLATARGEGFQVEPERLFDPAVNIRLGTKHLARLCAQVGTWDRALSAYNGGIRPHLGFGERVQVPGVRCMGRVVPVGEFCNQAYVDRVLSYQHYFATGVESEGSGTAAGLLALLGLVLSG